MCRSLRKYKCGTCAACYSIKRNSLAIRLREHYCGYLRHFSKNQYAILFGMLTFDDEHLPPIQPNSDIVCNWQKPIQSFLKRLNKLYPFLKFEYYISAEFGKKGRLHCHPLWFVVPRDVTPVFKGATEQRFNDMLSALADSKTYKVKLLHSESKKRREFAYFTAFELYVHNILRDTYNLGISECSPIQSVKAVVYATKYMTKSRNIAFRRRVWLSDDSQRKTSNFIVVDDPFFKVSNRLGVAVNPSTGTSFNVSYLSPRQKKRFYIDFYKSYLISRGIGDYFYETPQWLDLLHNFKLETKVFHLDAEHSFELTLTPSLRWYDDSHAYNVENKGYSLPLKFRKRLYDLLAPIGTLERAEIATAGINKLDYHFLAQIVGLCESQNIPYTLVSTGDYYLPDIRISSENWKRLNDIQLQNYYQVSRLKQFLYEK